VDTKNGGCPDPLVTGKSLRPIPPFVHILTVRGFGYASGDSIPDHDSVDRCGLRAPPAWTWALASDRLTPGAGSGGRRDLGPT